MAQKDGEVVPVGAGVLLDGAVQPYAMMPDPGDDPEDILAGLLLGMIQERDRLRAVGVVVACTLLDDAKALQVGVQHATGQCRAFVTRATEVGPKRLFGRRRRLAFSELEEVPTEALVWAVDLDD